MQADISGFIAGDAVQFGQRAVFTGNKNVGTNKAIAVNAIRAEDGMPDATTQPPTCEATAAALAMLLSGDGGRVTLPDLERLPQISFEPGLRRLLLGAPAPAVPAAPTTPLECLRTHPLLALMTHLHHTPQARRAWRLPLHLPHQLPRRLMSRLMGRLLGA